MEFFKLEMLIKLGREFGRKKIRDAGFSDTEHAICAFLCFHDNVSQDTISKALILDKTTVAKSLRSLEEKDYIVRKQNEQNRRKNIVRITEAGKNSVSQNSDIYEQWLSNICIGLSIEEMEQMDVILEKITKRALKLRNKKQHEGGIGYQYD